MIFPNTAVLAAQGYDDTQVDGALTDTSLLADIEKRLAERAREVSGSSTRVARAVVLAEPPSMSDGEMTAKGNLNYRKVLDRRKAILERLYSDTDPSCVKV